MRGAAVILAAAALSGCVRRAVVVETDPPGAEVWMDGDNVGLSPVRVPFAHYGTREIAVSKGGYVLVHELRPVEPPWFQRFPLDFVMENLWPGTLVDERYLIYTLKPEVVDVEAVMARAGAMKRSAAKPPETIP